MRRFLAGLVSGGVGVGIYTVLGPSKPAVLASGAAVLATYGFIDWLGVLPEPFEPTLRDVLHDRPKPMHLGEGPGKPDVDEGNVSN